jgi:ABC-2 type transport system permease protein/lipopolysaccharide transport system permease protein
MGSSQLNLRQYVGELWAFRHVLTQMVSQQLTLRYRRTLLGFLWTLVNPLLTMTISAFVFSMIMRLPLKNFVIFLYAGTIPWTLFSASITQGGGSILSNEGLIKKIYIPRIIFPLSISISLLVDTLLGMGALFVIGIILGINLSAALFFLPVSFLILYVFCLGVTLLSSVAFVHFRDLNHLSTVFLQALYYLTPIIYPPSFVSPRYLTWFELNPIFYFVSLFRGPIYESAMPSSRYILIAALISIITCWAGLELFRRREARLIFRL